jgi:hypothetical protein
VKILLPWPIRDYFLKEKEQWTNLDIYRFWMVVFLTELCSFFPHILNNFLGAQRKSVSLAFIVWEIKCLDPLKWHSIQSNIFNVVNNSFWIVKYDVHILNRNYNLAFTWIYVSSAFVVSENQTNWPTLGPRSKDKSYMGAILMFLPVLYECCWHVLSSVFLFCISLLSCYGDGMLQYICCILVSW